MLPLPRVNIVCGHRRWLRRSSVVAISLKTLQGPLPGMACATPPILKGENVGHVPPCPFRGIAYFGRTLPPEPMPVKGTIWRKRIRA